MKNSICWYCKRLTDENHFCPWVDDGVPVDGWEIEDEHKIDGSLISTGTDKTCTVCSCPLFIKAQDSICLLEFFSNAATELGIRKESIRRKPKKFFELYREKIGELPEWVIEEMNNIQKK